MKCPCCQREMHRGYLSNSNQPVQWIPEGNRPSFWKTGVAEGAVVLGTSSFWRGYRAAAFYCPSCKTVTIPVKSE